MFVKSLELNNFRNYSKKTNFEFDEDVNLIIGPNGIGKTNILEAIHSVSLGKSPRAVVESDLINVDSGFARVVLANDTKDKYEFLLERKESSSRVQKIYKINNARKTGPNFVGQMRSVMFAPEDIRMVAGSPSRRREYLDRVLVQVYPEYRGSLTKYQKVLKHRNKLLDSIRGQVIRHIHTSQLEIWNKQLVDSGKIIQECRRRFFEYLSKNSHETSEKLFGVKIDLELQYKENHISEKRMDSLRSKELAVGLTQLGPHRDDFSFVIKENGKQLDLKEYGSRGQQRTGVLCLKYMEINFMEDITKSRPILLLDDIFSELDVKYREAVLNIINQQQTFITCADEGMVPSQLLSSGKRFDLG